MMAIYDLNVSEKTKYKLFQKLALLITALTKNGKHMFTRTRTQTHFYPVWNVQREEDLTHGGGMRKEGQT